MSKLPNKESAPAASAAVTPAAVFGSAASSTPAAVFGGAASSTPAAVFGSHAPSTPAAMFGSAASGQKTFGSLAVDTPSTFGAKGIIRTVHTFSFQSIKFKVWVQTII